MDSFIHKVTERCFPKFLRPPVFWELKDPASYRNKVTPLFRLCILSILKREIRPGSTGDILLKLLSDEELDIVSMGNNEIDDLDIFIDRQMPFIPSGPEAQYYARHNPKLMKEIWVRNLDSEKHKLVCIQMFDRLCKVRIGDDVVMIAPMYLGWGRRYMRIAFQKNIETIRIELMVRSVDDPHGREDLNRFLSHIGLIAPGHSNWDSAESSIYSSKYEVSRTKPVVAYHFVRGPTEHPENWRRYFPISHR